MASDQVFSSGCAGLDHCLPAGGYLPGSVVESLRATPACGASYLAFAAAAAAMRASQGFLLVVDTRHEIYPPALLSHGINLDKVIFVRPDSQADALWSVDQGLRTPAVAAVVAELELVDDRAARRLQLAAEQGNGLGLLLRSIAARRAPSWAEVQWIVRGAARARAAEAAWVGGQGEVDGGYRGRFTTAGRRLQVQLARVRGGTAGSRLWLEINSATGEIATIGEAQRERNRHEQQNSNQPAQPGAVRLASELAGAARPSRRAAAG